MTALEAPVGSEDGGGTTVVDMLVVLGICEGVYDGGKDVTMRRECRQGQGVVGKFRVFLDSLAAERGEGFSLP